MKSLKLALVYTILAPLALLVMLPFVWMLSTSLKERAAIFVFPPDWIPNPVVWANYPEALTMIPFSLFLRNTCIHTFSSMIGILISSSLVAYSFARLRWPGRDLLFLIVLSTMMLPFQVTMIPQFILFRKLGWIDTFLPIIVPWYFGGGAFNIFLLRQFFMTIPTELDDAARIDGCSILGIYWRILLPLAKPALAAVAIFAFQARWNAFLGPLIYLQSRENFTLALGLRLFQEQYWVEWHLLMAASIVVMMPVILVFYFSQRYFIQGIVFTGIKG